MSNVDGSFRGSKVPAEQLEIPYETSRGCWWGQKHHCTFCGFDEQALAFRHKSLDRVIEDLRALLDAYPTRIVSMTDAIMPYQYFRTLLPRLAGEELGATIHYEQKANLTLEHILALKQAGITSLQPGIESLSSRLLDLMNDHIHCAGRVSRRVAGQARSVGNIDAVGRSAAERDAHSRRKAGCLV